MKKTKCIRHIKIVGIIPTKEMKGAPNKNEKKALHLMEKAHKGAKRKKNFSGKIWGVVGSGGFPQQKEINF